MRVGRSKKGEVRKAGRVKETESRGEKIKRRVDEN